MYESCHFGQEELLIASDSEKQAVIKRKGEKEYSTNTTILSAFVVAAKHPKSPV